MEKYTKGEWRVKKIRETKFITNASGQMFIAQVLNYDTREAFEANAKLIAAAPELLRALREIVEYNDRGELAEDLRKRIDRVGAEAIQKATT